MDHLLIAIILAHPEDFLRPAKPGEAKIRAKLIIVRVFILSI